MSTLTIPAARVAANSTEYTAKNIAGFTRWAFARNLRFTTLTDQATDANQFALAVSNSVPAPLFVAGLSEVEFTLLNELSGELYTAYINNTNTSQGILLGDSPNVLADVAAPRASLYDNTDNAITGTGTTMPIQALRDGRKFSDWDVIVAYYSNTASQAFSAWTRENFITNPAVVAGFVGQSIAIVDDFTFTVNTNTVTVSNGDFVGGLQIWGVGG